jgi:hypothetical protein
MRKCASRLRIPDNDHCRRSPHSRRWATFDLHVSLIVSFPVTTSVDDNISRFESPGTMQKKLSFSEFWGNSYEAEVSHRFTEYLKLCFRTCSRPVPNLSSVLIHMSLQQKNLVNSTRSTQSQTQQLHRLHPLLLQPSLSLTLRHRLSQLLHLRLLQHQV